MLALLAGGCRSRPACGGCAGQGLSGQPVPSVPPEAERSLPAFPLPKVEKDTSIAAVLSPSCFFVAFLAPAVGIEGYGYLQGLIWANYKQLQQIRVFWNCVSESLLSKHEHTV
jgi:hypothetical protein